MLCKSQPRNTNHYPALMSSLSVYPVPEWLRAKSIFSYDKLMIYCETMKGLVVHINVPLIAAREKWQHPIAISQCTALNTLWMSVGSRSTFSRLVPVADAA